jgi:tetratricopeptide (TPR) repeat protein
MATRNVSSRTVVIISLVLAGATIAAYWGLWNNDFVWFDDSQYVTDNEHIKNGLSWDVVIWAFSSSYAGNWHPLTWLSHALDITLFGLKPLGHHLVNLGLHIANTLLLFWFLVYTTRRIWVGAFVAALFALHPLHVESVAWAAERKDVLSTFFWMLAMLAYAHYANRPNVKRYCLVLLLFALGLLSKPMLVTLPIVFLLLDFWPLERIDLTREQPSKIWRLVAEKLPLLAMSATSAVVTIISQKQAIVTMSYMDTGTRVTNIIVSYGRYIWEMLWPTGMAVLYPRPVTPVYWQAALIGTAILAATLVAWRLAHKRKYIIIGWFWYLVTLVPVIGIVHVGMQSHADRYTYIPFVGLFMVLAWAAGDIVAARPQLRVPAAVCGMAVLLALGVITSRQVGYWKNDVSIFARATAVTKNNFVMLTNLGDALLWRGDMAKAEVILRKALEAYPQPDSYFLLAIISRRQGHIEEAVKNYKLALTIDPEIGLAWFNAGALLSDLQRYTESEQYFRKALELTPNWPEAYAGLGMTLGETGHLDEGIAACMNGIEINPKAATPYRILASLKVKKGLYEEAEENYKKSLALEPDYSAWTNLGDTQLQMGKLAEAEKSCREALSLNAKGLIAQYNLGLVLEKQGRKEEALAATMNALAIDPNYAEARDLRDKLKDGK